MTPQEIYTLQIRTTIMTLENTRKGSRFLALSKARSTGSAAAIYSLYEQYLQVVSRVVKREDMVHSLTG